FAGSSWAYRRRARSRRVRCSSYLSKGNGSATPSSVEADGILGIARTTTARHVGGAPRRRELLRGPGCQAQAGRLMPESRIFLLRVLMSTSRTRAARAL